MADLPNYSYKLLIDSHAFVITRNHIHNREFVYPGTEKSHKEETSVQASFVPFGGGGGRKWQE
jgi:hypothetical protein